MSKIKVSKLTVRKSAKCSGIGRLSKRQLQQWWQEGLPVRFRDELHQRLELAYGESIKVRLRGPFFRW